MHSRSRATFFRHSAVPGLPAVHDLRKVSNDCIWRRYTNSSLWEIAAILVMPIKIYIGLHERYLMITDRKMRAQNAELHEIF